MIPSDFIDELLSKVDIVDIIDEQVPLKKGGANYMACCPFHKEKTPSFSVSPTKQFYHCFSCGAHGSAIGFVMEHQGLSFPEAVQFLADRVGMTVPKVRGQEDNPEIRAERKKKAADFGRNDGGGSGFLRATVEIQSGGEGLFGQTRLECGSHRALRFGLCARRLATFGTSVPTLSEYCFGGYGHGH